MTLRSTTLAVALLAVAPIGLAGGAGAMPLGMSPDVRADAPAVQTVQWRGGPRWGGGWGWGPGLAAGAIIGGAIAATQPWYGYDYAPGYYSYGYAPGYYDYGYSPAPAPGYPAPAPGYASDDASYCAQRYRSYDPASGTYLGFDGLRHPCP
jgi:hypothetical protein